MNIELRIFIKINVSLLGTQKHTGPSVDAVTSNISEARTQFENAFLTKAPRYPEEYFFV